MTSRPDIPDFKRPPLNEAVMGVQFTNPVGYQQIRAGDVWALYRDRYPLVEEQMPLSPTFETFGLPRASQFPFGLLHGASHDRFWFLTPGKEELIQFQNDRLLHNWRQVGESNNVYPRFEVLFEKFENELRALEAFMSGIAHQSLKINQAEITYINHIPYELRDGQCPLDEWLEIVKLDGLGVDDIALTTRRTISTQAGLPYARLSCEGASAITPFGKRVFALNLTFRGAPQGESIEAALAFLAQGRQMIVECFAQITTKKAHQVWERIS